MSTAVIEAPTEAPTLKTKIFAVEDDRVPPHVKKLAAGTEYKFVQATLQPDGKSAVWTPWLPPER